MALGGGTFTTQNKKLPGTYENFVSLTSAGANASDRGYTAMAIELDWGEENKIFTVTAGNFIKNSRDILGYDYTDSKLKGLRDLFKNASVAYLYRLTSGGTKAENTYATALYSGTRGNDITIKIAANVDTEGAYDVITYLSGSKVDKVDTQTVLAASELKDNKFVTFKKEAELEETAGMPLTGGTNADVTGEAHQTFLDKIGKYTDVNAIGVVTTDKTINSLYAAHEKRMREEVGVKFQTVVYNYQADYEGVVNVKNKVLDEGENEASMVYWTTGVIAGCAVNASNTNKVYDGEYEVDTDYEPEEMEAAIEAGEFAFYEDKSEVRVLTDINSLVSITAEKGEIFKLNQTIRIIDQIGTDIAVLFNTKYLGVMPNDATGRTSLWNDITEYLKKMQNIRAIEGFSDSDVTVEKGDEKRSVVVTYAITIANTMEKLYMTVTVG